MQAWIPAGRRRLRAGHRLPHPWLLGLRPRRRHLRHLRRRKRVRPRWNRLRLQPAGIRGRRPGAVRAGAGPRGLHGARLQRVRQQSGGLHGLLHPPALPAAALARRWHGARGWRGGVGVGRGLVVVRGGSGAAAEGGEAGGHGAGLPPLVHPNPRAARLPGMRASHPSSNVSPPWPVPQCLCEANRVINARLSPPACVCDAAAGWVRNPLDGECACAAEGFTAVGDDCVPDDACTQDPAKHCAPDITYAPPRACSRTDPRRCAACALGYVFDAGSETVRGARAADGFRLAGWSGRRRAWLSGRVVPSRRWRRPCPASNGRPCPASQERFTPANPAQPRPAVPLTAPPPPASPRAVLPRGLPAHPRGRVPPGPLLRAGLPGGAPWCCGGGGDGVPR